MAPIDAVLEVPLRAELPRLKFGVEWLELTLRMNDWQLCSYHLQNFGPAQHIELRDKLEPFSGLGGKLRETVEKSPNAKIV